MALSRAQIKADALDILGEDLGTDGLDRPAMLDAWLNAAADELARATDCFWASASADLFAGQSAYPAPALYKIKSALWTDTAGVVHRLGEMSPSDLDGFRAGWRNAPVGSPRRYLVEGDNLVRLDPAPDTTTQLYAYTDLSIPAGGPANVLTSAARPFVATDAGLILRQSAGGGFAGQTETVTSVTGGAATLGAAAGAPGSTGGVASLSQGGLTVEGFGVPGGSWPGATDLCPLPERAHLGVVWRVAIFRATQFATPASLARMPLLQAEYRRQRGLLEAESHRLSQATGHADLQRFPFGGGFV